MEFLSGNGQIARVNGKIADALKAITGKFATRLQVVKALKAFLLNPSGAEIGQVLKDLGINTGSFQEFLKENETALTVLVGKVGDLAEHELKWDLSKGKKIGKGDWSVDASADFKAAIDVDVKEEDEKETPVDELDVTLGDQDALVAIGVEGKVSVGGKAAASGAAAGGTFQADLAFGAGAEILFQNCFLHQRSEEALAALGEDVEDMRLPFSIDSADDLRLMSKPDSVIPLQWVYLKAAGNVNFGASFSWGGTWINTGTVSDDSLNVDETIDVTTGVSAGVSVSHALSGAFELVLSASPTPGLVRASLKKSRSSQRQSGFSLKAGVEIEGLDKVGRAILDQFQPTLDAIVKKIEDQEKSFPDLKTLVTDAVGDEVDKLLGKTKVDDQIADFLKKFGKNVNIADELKKLAEKQVLDLTGDEINKIEDNLDKVRDELKKAIKRYRDLAAKVNSGLQKAANLKIAASFSRSWQKLSAREAALTVDLDPSLHADAYRDLVRGDFAPALQLFQDGAPGIQVAGKLEESGSRSVTGPVSLSVFGIVLGSTSVLSQDWELEVAASGDLMLGVKGSFVKTTKIWRQSRTFGFMVDGRVLDTLAGGVLAGDPKLSPTVTLELGREGLPAQEKKLARFQDEIISLGVASPPLDIHADVSLPTVKDKKNRLAASIVLKLEKRHLDAFLGQGLPMAERVYAASIVELALKSHAGLQKTDAAGNPFLLWESVRNQLATQTEGTSRTYTSGDGSASVTVDNELPIARLALIEVNRFRVFFTQLSNFQVNVQGKSPEEARKMVLAAQKELLKSAKKLSAGFNYNLALFRTVFALANNTGDLDPVAVVTRATDQRVFMYG